MPEGSMATILSPCKSATRPGFWAGQWLILPLTFRTVNGDGCATFAEAHGSGGVAMHSQASNLLLHFLVIIRDEDQEGSGMLFRTQSPG